MVRDRQCVTSSVEQGSRGLPHLGDGQGQVPEGVESCGAVATLAAGQRALQLPNEEVWWGGTEQGESPGSPLAASPALPSLPPALLTADAAVLPLLVPPPHLPALLVVTASMGTQQGTEHGLGDTSLATQPRGTCEVTVPGLALRAVSCPGARAVPALTGGDPGCRCWPGAAPARGSPRCAARPAGTAGIPEHPAGCKTRGMASERLQGAQLPPPPCSYPPLLVADEAWGVSLDLRLELGGAHALVGGRGPEQLNQLCKLCRQRGGSAEEVARPCPLRATLWGLTA